MSYDNTVVTASDMNYFWGVLMLIGSMRLHGMQEPVIVLGIEYTDEAKKVLKQLGDVTVVDADRGQYSLTCQKPNVMLMAKTKYVSWVDCDGYFNGNCSAALAPKDEATIHIRRRSREENKMVYPDSSTGRIPQEILDAWQADVGELTEPVIDTCCSCCYVSVATSQREFIARWRDQMNKVLPTGDIGVVDRRSKAYFQTDESVMNSLLAFMKGAPAVEPEFKLDKNPDALFIHFVAHPKPWHAWGPQSIRHYKTYIAVADYLRKNYQLPSSIPFPLKSENKTLCKLLVYPVKLRYKLSRLRKKLSNRLK